MKVTARFQTVGIAAAALFFLLLAVYHHHHHLAYEQSSQPLVRSSGLTRALVVTEQANVRRTLQAPRTQYVGNDGEDIFPLGLCEGDCDYDEDCEGDLICQERDPGDDVPGCSLLSIDRESSADFCVQKQPADLYNDEDGDADEGSDGNEEGNGAGVESFALKLHWREGYFWQEETVEREWCMRCRNGCLNYSTIRIITCDESRNTQWSFIMHDTLGQEAQIRVSDQPLCMEVETDYPRDVFLAACDPSEEKQRFIAQGGSFLHSNSFEITSKVLPRWCLTQIHHPKEDETIFIRPCYFAQRDETSYWDKF